jgi:hypothetical protein
MHLTRPYLLIRRCPFSVWSSLDSVILCEYEIRGSPFGEKRAYGHFLQVFSPRKLRKSSELEFSFRIPVTILCSLQLNGHTLFKGDESYADPES